LLHRSSNKAVRDSSSVSLAVAESVYLAVAAGRQSGGFFEDSAEGGGVAVAGAAADLVDRVACRFKKVHGVLDAGMPQVRLRPVAGGGRKAAGQGAFAEPEPGRELADLERAVQLQVDVLLNLVHDQVVVRSFPAERDVGELAGAVAVDQEDLGGEVGAVVTGETFDEVQDQVQERGRPA